MQTVLPAWQQEAAFASLRDPKERAKLSVQQLSEYLLKPVLSCAAINREL
jgi:hypothetical protein